MNRKHTAKLRNVIFVVAALFLSSAFAGNNADTETRIYDFPLLDFPYNIGRAPSMKQSMQLSNDFTYGLHNAWLDLTAEQGVRDWASQELPIYLFDYMAMALPLGAGWMHEEWHRAVLGRRGIDSYNGLYDFNLSSSTVSVSRVQDESLIALKRDYPQEFVRLHAAGFESQYEQNLEFEKQAFFNRHSPVMGAQLWLNHLGNILYMDACASNAWDAENDRINLLERTIVVRDSSGMDCKAWTYDLFRPHEAYSARGQHPTGVGIDRYIKWSDLTADEQRYLTRQRNLSLLNLIDPFLFGQQQFSLPSGDWRWNANLRHMLTPFGYDIAANVFLKSRDNLYIFGAVHTYHNDQTTALGLDVTLPRYPASLFGQPVHVTPRVFAWMQPENLMFHDPAAKLGGLASVRVDVPVGDGWEVYGEMVGKSKGWVAGNEYLGNSTALRMGFNKVIETKARWKQVVSATEIP
jgi:hypothetical protein